MPGYDGGDPINHNNNRIVLGRSRIGRKQMQFTYGPGSRSWVASRVTVALRKAKSYGRKLSVTDEAVRLSKHPAVHLSLDEIKDVILTVAVSERTPMELDSLHKG